MKRYACVFGCLLLSLTGCSSQPRDLSRSEIQYQTPAQNATSALLTPTPDGSGQTVEPTVLDFPDGWNGFRYWMAISPLPTPYPKNLSTLENPSILVSQDGTDWNVPPGLTNPVAVPTQGLLADGSIVYDSDDDELWLYYINDISDSAGTNHEYLLRVESKDGVNWTKPHELLAGLNYPFTSPAVVKFRGLYYLWTVVAGASGCASASTTIAYRTSTDGIQWSTPRPVNLSVPNYIVWHLNVTRVARTNQLLVANTAYPVSSRSCGDTILFAGTSWDGVTWSDPQIMLNRGARNDWDGLNVYRSSFIYDDTESLLRIWYSAEGPRGWHVGYSQTSGTITNQTVPE
jgi:hypothetical protein